MKYQFGPSEEFQFDENTAVKHGFDQETMQEVTGLRDIRTVILRAQLEDVEGTLNEMISRGLLEESEREECRVELAGELIEKLQRLEKRLSEDEVIYGDEVDLFLDTTEQELESQLSSLNE